MLMSCVVVSFGVVTGTQDEHGGGVDGEDERARALVSGVKTVPADLTFANIRAQRFSFGNVPSG